MKEEDVLGPIQKVSMVPLTENSNEAMGVLSEAMRFVCQVYDVDL